MNNNYFKSLSKKVNPIILERYDISLNFYNFDQFHQDIVDMDNLDVEGLYSITHDALIWSNYCSEIYNLLMILEEEKKSLRDKFIGVENLIKKEIQEDNSLSEDAITILNKYNIANISELQTLIDKNTNELKDLKKFNKILKAKIRFFEGIHFKSRHLLSKAIYDLHFGFSL